MLLLRCASNQKECIQEEFLQKDSNKKNTQQEADSDNKKQGKENVVDADFEEVKEDKDDKDKEKRA